MFAAKLKVPEREAVREVAQRIAEGGVVPELHRLNHGVRSAYNLMEVARKRAIVAMHSSSTRNDRRAS